MIWLTNNLAGHAGPTKGRTTSDFSPGNGEHVQSSTTELPKHKHVLRMYISSQRCNVQQTIPVILN